MRHQHVNTDAYHLHTVLTMVLPGSGITAGPRIGVRDGHPCVDVEHPTGLCVSVEVHPDHHRVRLLDLDDAFTVVDVADPVHVVGTDAADVRQAAAKAALHAYQHGAPFAADVIATLTTL